MSAYDDQAAVEPLLTADEVCAILKVKKSWLYDTVEDGLLKSVRLGEQLRFRPSSLARYLDDWTAPGSKMPGRSRGLSAEPPPDSLPARPGTRCCNCPSPSQLLSGPRLIHQAPGGTWQRSALRSRAPVNYHRAGQWSESPPEKSMGARRLVGQKAVRDTTGRDLFRLWRRARSAGQCRELAVSCGYLRMSADLWKGR